MDKELLCFVIETLLLKSRPQMGMIAGCSTMGAPQSSDCDIVHKHSEEMRDLIAERVANNADAIADAIMGMIKLNAGMKPEVMFEWCDKVVSEYQQVPTNKVSSFDPNLCGTLVALLSYCNHSFIPPMMNPYDPQMMQPGQSKDASKMYGGQYGNPLMPYVTQLQGYTANVKVSIEAFIKAILSSRVYSPLTILQNCSSKVVILHDCPDKDKLRAIADEKGMVVLTTSTDSMEPEVGLSLMINAYNSTEVDNDILFPKEDRRSLRHVWSRSITTYLAVEKYINTTDGIRDELMHKAPEFLKDFDEELAIIHKEYNL